MIAMNKVPITSFSREIRKHIRAQETIQITCRGKHRGVMITAKEYDACLAQLASAVAL